MGAPSTAPSPVLCASCGAPVPLAAVSPTPCAHCGAAVVLPVLHVDLYARLTQGAAELAEGERMWATLPRPLPRWIPITTFAALPVVVLSCVALWVSLAPADHPGRFAVLLIVAPTMLALQLALELLAYWSPLTRLEVRFSAQRDPAHPALVLCRQCGAPLTPRPAAIVLRCAYCSTDNLVRSLGLAAYRRAREVSEGGRAQLDEAIANARSLGTQRTIVRISGGLATLGVTLGLLAALWSR